MRREDEQLAIDAVFKSLKLEDKVPIEDKSIDDNPDCVFELESDRIAADCTNINLEAVMKWSNSTRRLKKDKQYEITFALEPHYWIKQSIIEKESKIPKYLTNSGATKIWLIAHALENPSNFDCDENILAIMRDAVRYVSPSFDSVWFVHTQYPATRLWNKGDPKIDNFPSWGTTNDKYPFEQVIQFKGVIKSDGLNKEVVFGDSFEKIILEPMDPKYSAKT